MLTETKRTGITGYEFYHTLEFKAICSLLGIPWELPTTNLTITIPLDGMVMLAHDYQASRHIPQVPPKYLSLSKEQTPNEHPPPRHATGSNDAANPPPKFWPKPSRENQD